MVYYIDSLGVKIKIKSYEKLATFLCIRAEDEIFGTNRLQLKFHHAAQHPPESTQIQKRSQLSLETF